MLDRIGPKKPTRLFLKEWRQKRGLSQDQLAARLETTKANVSRKENDARKVTTEYLAAVAYALDCAPEDLFRHPDQPTADQLLRQSSPAVRELVLRVLKTGTDG